MKYKLSDRISEFTCIFTDNVKNINSELYLFEHNITKTKVLAIKNDDSNKTFSVSFPTFPVSPNGVAHIIEHTVLSGSKKYPVRNVFDELTKRGLTTFINAMTSPDKTTYPFATRNETEYFNLMDVYLDVTLNPLLEKEEFLQEGWHYEFDDKLRISGVVYNEMKGVFSSAFAQMRRILLNHLLHGSTYANVSGGHPNQIPELSYDEFVAFHHRHYHPSRALIGLYGDANLEKELHFLHENQLTNFDFAENDEKLLLSADLANEVSVEDVYSASVNEGDDIFVNIGIRLGGYPDMFSALTTEIINNVLFFSDASPLKTKIIDAGYGKDLMSVFASSYAQSYLSIVLIGADSSKLAGFKSAFFNALQEIVNEGLDSDLLISEFNSFEFSEKENSNSPQRGLFYLMDGSNSIFHNGNLKELYNFEEILADIRDRALNNRYFEQFIQNNLLNNEQRVVLTLKPDSKLAQKEESDLQSKLANLQAEMSAAELESVREMNRKLHEKQEMENTPEQLALLPSLRAKDLPNELFPATVDHDFIDGFDALSTEVFANGICYYNIGFDVRVLSFEEYQILPFFSEIATEIGTSNRNYQRFSTDINIYTGGINASFSSYRHIDDSEQISPILWFGTKSLTQYQGKTFELLLDIFKNVDFSDHERIIQILHRQLSWRIQSLRADSFRLPFLRNLTYHNSFRNYEEHYHGISPTIYLQKLLEGFPHNFKQFLEKLESIKTKLFNRNNMTFHVTGSAEHIAESKKHLQDLLSKLPVSSQFRQEIQFPPHAHNEAFIVPAQVVYCVQTQNFFEAGGRYNGSLEVLSNLLERDYLHRRVRMKGGAYGVWTSFRISDGLFSYISYRDPNVAKTFEAYDGSAEFIANITLSHENLEQRIIKSYSAYDSHLSPAQIGGAALNREFIGMTHGLRNRHIQELLGTSVHDLRDYAEIFQKMKRNSTRSIIGNGEKIHSDKHLFTKIIEI